MTTPKSPEEIVRDFMSDRAFLTRAGRIEAETSLRSSMASLLLYMAKQLPTELRPRTKRNISFLEGVEHARTLLTNEAKKITNNE